jgi:hypothetical protein
MISPVNYNITLEDGEHHIIITPVNQNLPGGNLYSTGVFRLSEGVVGMGEIVFDDDMREWEYTGMGDLTHDEAEDIANFIRNYKDPETVI